MKTSVAKNSRLAGRSAGSAKSTPPKRSILPGSLSLPRLPGPTPESTGGQWTFLTNHAHVLVVLARSPSSVLRDVAAEVGITERAVQRIIADLESGRFIERRKVGRQNHYRVLFEQPLRHPIESHRSIGDLLAMISGPPPLPQ